MQIAEKPLLRLDVSSEDGIRFEPRGPLAVVARPVVERINRLLKDEKPVSSGPDRFIFSTWIPPAPSPAFDRMISAQVGAIIGRKVPDQFSIAIIRGCPNRCIHCAAPSREGPVLGEAEINGAVDQALDLGSYMITFDGGEPMLRKELPTLVSHVDDRAIAATFTSGYGLSEDLASSLQRAGLYAVRISIDSPHPEEHDRIRGRSGAYSDAIQGARNALDAGLLVDLFMVTSPANIDDLEDAYGLALDLGVHEMTLYDIVAVGRWADHEDEVLSATDVHRLEAFQRDKNGKEGPRVTSFPYLLGPDMFGCFAGRRWIHVDASGDALPCAYMPISFGNVREKRLRDIWKAMSGYRWFKGRQVCQMKDPAFREAHPQLFVDQGSGRSD